MTGAIILTRHNGGAIRCDGDGKAVPFRWCDCVDIHPNDCGFSTRVRFYIEIINGREFAIAVRREEI